MKLYSFSLFAKRRDAARVVVETVADLSSPGAAAKLKQNVDTWLKLHREVTKLLG